MSFFDDTKVLITEASEGARLAQALGDKKAAIRARGEAP